MCALDGRPARLRDSRFGAQRGRGARLLPPGARPANSSNVPSPPRARGAPAASRRPPAAAPLPAGSCSFRPASSSGALAATSFPGSSAASLEVPTSPRGGGAGRLPPPTPRLGEAGRRKRAALRVTGTCQPLEGGSIGLSFPREPAGLLVPRHRRPLERGSQTPDGGGGVSRSFQTLSGEIGR